MVNSWLPIGPDFVFSPRNSNFKRLSLHNEEGQQGMVSNIAIHPTNSDIIYVVVTPNSGGASAFRTETGGKTWEPIIDSLQRDNPALGPACIAINPDHPNTIYLGTNRGVYVSNERGESWGPRNDVGGWVRKLIVDPLTASDLNTTYLYAATDTGVYRSTNGGTTWSPTPLLSGDVWSLVHIPSATQPHFYAGVKDSGVFHTTNTTGMWELLSTGAMDYLPRPMPNSVPFIDYCRLNPARVYVWIATDAPNHVYNSVLYTTSSGPTGWRQVNMVSPVAPDVSWGPWYPDFYAVAFAVSPNSTGNEVDSMTHDTNDILFFGNRDIFRSVNGGKTWTQASQTLHPDQHAIAFSPANPSRGQIPSIYFGCDGGICKSTKFADARFHIDSMPDSYNEGLDYNPDNGWLQNLNHGMQTSAVYNYASDPAISALGYIGCQDTGVAAASGALSWRGMLNNDGGAIAVARGPDGLKVWYRINERFYALTDKGEYAPRDFATLNIGGSNLECKTEVLRVTSDQKCLAGVIVPGRPPRSIVVRINQHDFNLGQAAVMPISQDFGVGVNSIATHPSDANIIYCVTEDQKVWMTNSGSTASSGTVWTEITDNRPTDAVITQNGNSIRSIAIDGNGNVYVLLRYSVQIGAVTSPMFKMSGRRWEHQQCDRSLPPSDPLGFNRLLVDPIQPNILYAGYRGKVYKLTLSNRVWNWEDKSEGLPGGWIYDLWIGNIAPSGSAPKVLLRAAIPARGVWELDVTSGANDPSVNLYLRDNLLDQGWLNISPEGLSRPYNPSILVWHYQCMDIKIDAMQTTTTPNFYQTDPEWQSSITHVIFDELKDNSQRLLQNGRAKVHVQVHNRSTTQTRNVLVWAIYCPAAAGVPPLNGLRGGRIATEFNFWNQFTVDHDTAAITPALPQNSIWTSIIDLDGHIIQTLQDIDAAHPQVASWNWQIPGLEGHYCMVVFIHSASSPITETIPAGVAPVNNSTNHNIDFITPRSKQIGQKNLHILGTLPPSAPAPGEESSITGAVEFHNPTSFPREARLIFDLQSLPVQLNVSFRLTPLKTINALKDSIKGIAKVYEEKAKKQKDDAFEKIVYEASPSTLVEVVGVIIPPFGFYAAELSIQNIGTLEKGSEYEFEAQQIVKEEVVGGSTFVVHISS